MVVERKPVVVLKGSVFSLGRWNLGDGNRSRSEHGDKDAHVQELGEQDGGQLKTSVSRGGGSSKQASRVDDTDADAYPDRGTARVIAPSLTPTPTPTPILSPAPTIVAATTSQAQPQPKPQPQPQPQTQFYPQDQDQDQNQNYYKRVIKGKRFSISIIDATIPGLD
jgi:hypothetical protein